MKIFAYRVTGASVFSRFDRSTTNRPPGKKRGDGPEIGRREIQGGREKKRDVRTQSSWKIVSRFDLDRRRGRVYLSLSLV